MLFVVFECKFLGIVLYCLCLLLCKIYCENVGGFGVLEGMFVGRVWGGSLVLLFVKVDEVISGFICELVVVEDELY